MKNNKQSLHFFDYFDNFKDKVEQQERKRIGKEFKKWFNNKNEAEDIEDAIIRITGVEIYGK